MAARDDSDSDAALEAGGSLDAASMLRAAPVLTRMALAAWWRATGWTIESSVRLSVRMARAAAAGEPPAELRRAAEDELRDYLRRLLGTDLNGSGPAHEGGPPASASAADAGAGDGGADGGHSGPDVSLESPPPDGRVSADQLRELGSELLRRSADLEYDMDGHPAYVRILQELAPDEGRMLRLLALEGPQPAVDVRTGGPLGVVKSDLVAGGLNLIARQAGCRHPERGHQYLNNLYRLGLVWFSREQLDDLPRYQVLEAQPEVAEAMEKAGRGSRTVRRSIHLTPFGIDFCKLCLPIDTAEIEALPMPKEAD